MIHVAGTNGKGSVCAFLEAILQAHTGNCLGLHAIPSVICLNCFFSAFKSSTTPVIGGTLVQISADRLTNKDNGVSYYLARVAVTEEGRKALGNLTDRELDDIGLCRGDIEMIGR